MHMHMASIHDHWYSVVIYARSGISVNHNTTDYLTILNHHDM